MKTLVIRLLAMLGLTSLFFPFIGIKLPISSAFEIRGYDVVKDIVHKIQNDASDQELIDKIRDNVNLEDWASVVKKIKKKLPRHKSEYDGDTSNIRNIVARVTLGQVLFVPAFYFMSYFLMMMAFITTDRYSLLGSAGLSLYAIFITMAANMCLKDVPASENFIREAIESLGRVQLYPGLAIAMLALTGFVGGVARVMTAHKKPAASS